MSRRGGGMPKRGAAARCMHVLLAGLGFAAAALPAGAGSLERPTEIDLVYVDRQTGQLELFIVLDAPVDTRPAVHALYAKVAAYCRHVESGRAVQGLPAASAALRPTVVLMAPRHAGSAELQNLQGVQLRAKKLGCRLEVHPHDANVKPDPRPIDG